MSGAFDADNSQETSSQMSPIPTASEAVLHARIDKLENLLSQLINRLDPSPPAVSGATAESRDRNTTMMGQSSQPSLMYPKEEQHEAAASDENVSMKIDTDPTLESFHQPPSRVPMILTNMAPPMLSSLSLQAVRTFRKK